MMPTHAPLSPSKRPRTSRCPGSARYPDTERAGPAAIDGTHSHTLLERCIKANLNDPLNMIGTILEDHEGQFKVDAERAQRVKVFVDWLRDRFYRLGGAAEICSETRVDPARLIGRSDMSGTLDALIVGGGVLVIGDYKDGMHPVTAHQNEQMEPYAVGVLAEYPVRPYPFEKIEFVICQPKLATKGMNPIDTWETTVEDIMNRVVPRLQREGAACDDPNAPRIPGEIQCRYCPAKGFCPELAAYSLNAAGIAFPQVTETRTVLPLSVTNGPLDVVEQAAQVTPAAMTDAQLVQVFEAIPLVTGMCASVTEELTKRLALRQIDGVKLVAGRGSRSWTLPEDQMEGVLKKLGMPKHVYYPPPKLISPAQAEKAAWQNRKGETVTLNDKKRKVLLTEYVAKVAGKPTVALASDERPALVSDVSSLFGAIEALTPAALPVAPDALPDWLK